MKTHFNNAEYAKKVMQRMQKLTTCLPPAILFDKAEKKSDKRKTKITTRHLTTSSTRRKKTPRRSSTVSRFLKVELLMNSETGMRGIMS